MNEDFAVPEEEPYLPNPFWRPRCMEVKLVINGTHYSAQFPSDADPAEVGRLVEETVRIAYGPRKQYTESDVAIDADS